MTWMDGLGELQAVRWVLDLVSSLCSEYGSVGLALTYSLAAGWLVHSRSVRFRQLARHNQSVLQLLMGGSLRLLGMIAAVTLGVLFALARAAGRSHYRW